VDHISHLATHFQRMGHQVRIIAPWSGGRTAPCLPILHQIGTVVPVPANGSVARITLSPLVSRRVKEILRTEQFDIVHIHEPLLPVLPLTVLRHSATSNVGTFHAYRQSNLGYFYGKPILKYFFRRLHGRIAVSLPALEFISQYFDGDIEIIPNGIEVERFGEHVTPLPGLRDGRPLILFVGRYNEPRKGFKYLLRALPQVRRAVPGARLVVVGKGKPERYRRYLDARGIDDVIFAGHVSHEELPRYYASCDVFCAPSTGRESFGIVLLEAMASRRPVVASDIPGYASVVTHGREGLLAEPKRPAALAEALVRLLQDRPQRDRMSEHGHVTATMYTWEKVSRRVVQYYRNVVVPERRLMRGVR
jgi:phosphatidylinositol alpha-mannosyltransferase